MIQKLPVVLVFLAYMAGDRLFAEDLFIEAGPDSGFAFTHYNGLNGRFFLPEIMGSGCALLDYDGDGDLDLYLVQGNTLPVGGDARKTLVPHKSGTPRDRLFRNDLTLGPDGKRTLRFVDVTEQAGVGSTGYGMGVTTGDVDNDGDVDIYVTNMGKNQLFVNNGDGSFSDGTDRAGVGDEGLGTSSAFFDVDRDGDLDLFVANYVFMDLNKYPRCFALDSSLDFCGPDAFPAVGDRFFLNRGDGTFVDASRQLSQADAGAGLGVVTADLDGDGWIDVYVANDGDPNHLWRNKGNGSFEDIGLLAGVSRNGVGAAEAGMGVTAADFDRDGDEDLFMTHLDGETNTLYTNQGDSFFDDGTNQSALGMPSVKFTGFGTSWVDLDNDGWLDLVVLNGAVRVQAELAAKGEIFPLQQVNQVFSSRGGKRFEDTSQSAGEAFRIEEVSRGLAFGDVDNDGDADLLITNCNGPARLLLNRGNKNHWLGLRLLEKHGKRDAIGAWVKLTLKGGESLGRRVKTDGSYCSAQDSRLLFGLGKVGTVKALHILWPDGSKEDFPALASNRYHTLRQGTGVKK